MLFISILLGMLLSIFSIRVINCNVHLGILSLFFSFAVIFVPMIIFIPKNHNKKYTCKIQELEKNTVFNIKDSIGGFKPKDSVWVNMTTLSVDPLDTVAMKCVVIEETK